MICRVKSGYVRLDLIKICYVMLGVVSSDKVRLCQDRSG